MAITDRILRGRTRSAIKAATAILATYGGRAWHHLEEYAPAVGRLASRRRKSIVIEPYRRLYSLRLTIGKIIALPSLALFCLVYGFFFGLTAPTLIVVFSVPIVLLVALTIWALPDQRTAPTLAIEFFYPALFVVLILWPNYVAISLPGLPWITILRIIGLPMAIFFLISLSVSPEFRRKTYEGVGAVKFLWKSMAGFILVQIATIVLSHDLKASTQLIFNQQIYWTTVFAIGCALFRDTRQVTKYFFLLCLLSIPIVLISVQESREQHVLWMSNIPKFLLPPDPSIANILTPVFRAGTNFFRVRATFSTPLEEAEYLSLLTPFLLYFGFSAKSIFLRVVSLIWIPVIFITIRLTDCRLGVAGMLVSVLLYGVLWSIVRWRAHSKDLLAAATVYLYPLLFVAGIGVVFASHRLHAMIFGGGAQAGSSAARESQLSMAIRAFEKAPWGHGAGQSGPAMGYPPGAFIAVDNHFITLLLDYGALGVVAWYGIFIVAIFQATRHSMSAKYAGRLEARLLAPLAVELSAFLLIKWVHGGDYTHPIEFMILGMVSALIYNLHYGSASVKAATSTTERDPWLPNAAVGALSSHDRIGRWRAAD